MENRIEEKKTTSESPSAQILAVSFKLLSNPMSISVK